jgi:hypothetical protein
MQQDRTPYIEKLYQDVLGRAPDAAGLEYWKQSTLGDNDMLQAFHKSYEGVKPRIEDMYRQVFGRIPDDEGVDYWANTGLQDTEILRHFHNSAEAAPRRAQQRDQEGVVLPSYLHEAHNFYGKPPVADWMQAGRSASEGINRMPGVFSDYGALSSMPGNLAHQMFYPKGMNPFEKKGGSGISDLFGERDPDSEDSPFNMLAELFGQLSGRERTSLFELLMGDRFDRSEGPDH